MVEVVKPSAEGEGERYRGARGGGNAGDYRETA